MLTKRDYAKYPFSKEAILYVEELKIKMDELISEEFNEIIDRAKKRIEHAIKFIEPPIVDWKNDDIELLSFSTSIAILSFIKDDRLKNRYSLVESKRAYKNFQKEDNFNKVLEIATNTFGWDLKKINKQNFDSRHEYELHFSNYLRNSVKIIDINWKLTNRIISQGYIYVTREEICRLLEEEVRQIILKKMQRDRKSIRVLENVIKEVEKDIHPLIRDSFSKKYAFDEVKIEGFPPCIKNLFETLKSGGNLSHVGRFTLTSFLMNIGADEKKLIKMFKEVMDFDEKKTVYQIEHIAGMRGSKTKYLPPKCETLKTHGICSKQDLICKEIKKPIDYYAKRTWQMKKKQL